MAQRVAKKNDALAQWSRQTPTVKVGVMFLVALLVGGLYYQFFLRDLRADKKAEEKSRATLLGTQASLNKRIDELEKLKTQRDALEAEVAGLEFALPSDAELNSFLDHLQTKAGDAGVAFKSWTNEAEVDAGKYKKVPLTVTVEGNFYQLMNYMYLLGPTDKEDAASGTSKFDRIVTVENIKITEANLRNDEILLTASFTAATFRQEAPPAPEATPGAPGAAPRGAPAGGAAPAPTFRGGGAPGAAGNRAVRKANEAVEKNDKNLRNDLKGAGATP